MVNTRATRAARASRRAPEGTNTAPGATTTRGRRGRPRREERANTDLHVEHPDSEPEHNGEEHPEQQADAESSRRTHHQSASSQGRAKPAPHTALLMAQELLRYQPTAEAHQQWLERLNNPIGIATIRPAPS